MANNAILVFDGTPTTVITTTATIATNIFTVSGTNATITEFDNSTDLWPMAKAVFSCPDTFAAAPAAGTTIDLYMCEQDIDGTKDEAAPSTTAQQGAKYIGSFRMYAADVDQPKVIHFSLSGIRKAKFYFQNKTAQTLSFSAGTTVKVEGYTLTAST